MIQLNEMQSTALEDLKIFIENDDMDVFILRGSAGTGKTTLIAKFAQYLEEIKITYALLAPTGRASRILGAKVAQIASIKPESSTIHRMIYRLDIIMSNDNEVLSENDPALRFYYPLNTDESTVDLFIVDESSMIGDKENEGDFIQFGSSRLLKDILDFCRIARFKRKNDHTTKIIFVGDMAQLPPVGENFSPALSKEYLFNEYGIKATTFDLTQVMRQSSESTILTQASNIRNAINTNKFNDFKIEVNNQDIYSLNYEQALSWIVDNITKNKPSVAVVYSNEKALEYNNGVREKLYGNINTPIQIADLLLVNKNSTLHQLSNGDLVKVLAVNSETESRSINLKAKDKQGVVSNKIINLLFRHIAAAYRSVSGDIQTDCFILENLLTSKNRELSALETRALYVDFLMRNPQAKINKQLKKELLKNDPYFNALQVKYGYAITCHKAQGGEWKNVLVDFSGIKGLQSKQFFQWAYTAITRTSQNLVVINPPKFNEISTMVWDNLVPQSKEQELNDGAMGLETIYQKILAKWTEFGFKVINTEHLQYCERYTILADNQQIKVQFYYNGKFKITRYEIMPNQNVDKELSNKILSAFNFDGKQQNSDDDFIGNFIKHIEKCLEDSNIKIVSHKEMSYRLRIKFSDGNRIGELDFNYNGEKNWTSVQEFGGTGTTNGLYQEISLLIKE